MKLYHTSPTKIEKITRSGLFDDCLFFSTDVYQMSISECVVYSIDASKLTFIDAYNLHDDEIIDGICKDFSIDRELAEALLDSSESVYNYNFVCDDEKADIDWELQTLRGKCAKKMGYDGCRDRDEQGSVYIIPMFARESLLILEGYQV
jgi:hypothetical protein